MLVVQADLNDPRHQAAFLELTKMYACDEMGNGGELPQDVMDRLVPELRKHPTAVIFLAFDGDRPAGIATCFRGFSTFKGRPLINVHDFAVHPDYRGHGVARQLMQAVEDLARRENCARLTLEVQSHNLKAQRAYTSFGFTHGGEGEFVGPLFLTKPLK